MYIRIGNRIINADHIVEVWVSPGSPARQDEETGEALQATPVSVEIATTAVHGDYDDGDIPRSAHYWLRPHTIALTGDEAEMFLAALPVYEPGREE